MSSCWVCRWQSRCVTPPPPSFHVKGGVALAAPVWFCARIAKLNNSEQFSSYKLIVSDLTILLCIEILHLEVLLHTVECVVTLGVVKSQLSVRSSILRLKSLYWLQKPTYQANQQRTAVCIVLVLHFCVFVTDCVFPLRCAPHGATAPRSDFRSLL